MGGDGPRDLGDFEGMRKAIPEMIGVAAGEDLGFRFEPPESARMNDAVGSIITSLSRVVGGSSFAYEVNRVRVFRRGMDTT